MYTPFWYNQPNVLYEKNSLFEIFPVKEYDMTRKLNAIVRFSVYYSIIVYVYKKDTNIFGVPLIALIVTYLIYKNSSSVQKDTFITKLKNDKMPLEDIPTQEHNIGCQLPTKDNPFMNTPFFDVAADK